MNQYKHLVLSLIQFGIAECLVTENPLHLVFTIGGVDDLVGDPSPAI